MELNIKSTTQGFSPKALIRLLLLIGLASMTIALIKQQIALALGVAMLPLIVASFGYGFLRPRCVLLIYATYCFFFTTIMRYTHASQLSVGLDVIVYYGVIVVLCASYFNKGSISWKNAINMLTISYIPWVIFSFFQLSNPQIPQEGISTGLRIWIFRNSFLYIILSLLANTRKSLQIGLDLISFLTLLAFLKLLWQKFIGFDDAELHWLYVEGGARTHIIHSGIRYFSFFTDAASFGGFMAAAGLVYAIIGFHYPQRLKKLWYFFISTIAYLGMFMSGTRGSLVIPFIAMFLYCFLCKNFRILIITAIAGFFIFVFFAFTNIGNGNEYIRRARTAFHASKDASMNVRVRNREEIAYYIAKHPLGYGFKGVVEKYWPQADGTYVKGVIPPDSFFVHIWIETGYFGLILYILMCCTLIIEGSRIVLFKIKDKLLRHILAAFTCATLGIWASGYTGDNPGMPPTDFVIVAMMAFVMNGATIDKELEKQKLLTSKTNNAI